MTAPVAPMESLKRLRDIVSQLDAAECPALYNQIQGELAVAEMVLRDVSPVQDIHCQEFHELAMDYRGESIASAPHAYAALCDYIELRLAAPVAPQPAMPTLPSTPEDVIDFLGSNIECMDAVGAVEDRRITLSVHDLLSAFQEFADSADDDLPEVAKTEEEKNAATRRMLDAFAAQPVQQAGDVARLDYMQRFIARSALRGFKWDNVAFTTDANIRDQIDAMMAKEKA